MSKWIGVDFDGTLAIQTDDTHPENCGAPILPMINKVKSWLAEGKDVRIFTARVFIPDPTIEDVMEYRRAKEYATKSKITIMNFCLQNFGRTLPMTCTKDQHMTVLYDDRCVQIIRNTGLEIGEL